MTTALTASIGGVIYPVKNTSFVLGNRVDQRSTLNLTIFDANNTYAFQFGQPVVIADTLEGVKFTGFIHKPIETKIAGQNAKWHTLSCMDNRFLADVVTSQMVVSQQYAGIVAAKMVSDGLGARGVSANYALRLDALQADFMAGTLNNTVATANNGGDLELAQAGSKVVITGAGAGFALGNGLKFTGYASSGYPNAYVYRQIWAGSQIIGSSGNDYFQYDVWISSDSPLIKAGIDFLCSDGTSLRDSTVTDQQGLSPHPNTDLSGLANDQWYTRNIFPSSAFYGKTIVAVNVSFEGDSQGTYTAYFRRISYNPSGGSQLVIFGDSSTLQMNSQVSNNGYSNVSLTQLQVEDKKIIFTHPSLSIDAAKIVRDSVMTYTSLIPTGCTGICETSIDNGASWQQHTSGNAIPNLLAGMVVAGRSIQYRHTLTTGKDPTVLIGFGAPALTINSAYVSSKTDVIASYQTATDFAAGTLTNLATVGSGSTDGITTNGFQRNWDNAFYGSQTFFGSGSQTMLNKQLNMQASATSDARSRLDFAGTWQNFTAEIDVKVPASGGIGLVYRTTNWGNSNDSYAYSVSLSTFQVLFAKGNNSTGAGAFTSLATAAIGVAAESVHRLKIVINGSSHIVYVDGVQYISASDSTYTAAGNIGLRLYNSTGSTIQEPFDNFGVCSALSGTWQSPSIDISGPGTYGNSVIQWDIDGLPDSTCLISAQTSIDGGSTFQNAANGGAISGLTAGASLAGKHLLIKMTLTASNADVVPVLNGVSVWIMGQYSSTGTRISPLLYLTPAGRAGSTLASYNAVQPTNTSVSLATSTDGTSYTSVANGGQIAGINTQPAIVFDTFDSNSSPNYVQGNLGGTPATIQWDTINSRLLGTSGNLGSLLYTSLSVTDGQAMADFDQCDGSGPVTNRNTIAGNAYYVQIWDASAGSNQNQAKLFRRASGTSTQIGSTATIVFPRGTYHRFVLDSKAGVLTVSMDGVQIITYTDGSPFGAGQMGLALGALARVYNLRLQGYGDTLAGKKAYGKLILTSTDPTQTPQITGFTLAALSPNIGLGALVDTASYQSTPISSNLDDLAKRSNSYFWTIGPDLGFVFNDRVATPAPYILQSSDQLLLLDGPLSVEKSGDLYRNKHTVKGVLDANGNPTQAISINNTNLAGTITQKQFAVIMGRSTAIQVVLNLPSGAVTTSGDVGDLDTSKCAQIAIDINITAITGTTPTIQFFVDRKDSNGLYFNLWQSNVVSATGQASTSIGPYTTIAQSLGSTVKLRYVITGTTPSVTFSVSVLGRLTVQSAGLGIVEVVEDVSSLNMSIAGATQYCIAQLQRYGTIGRTLTFKTRRSNPSLTIGQYLPAFIPEHGLNDASMLITSVDTAQKIVADGSGGVTQEYRQSVTATENANTQSVWKLLASTIH